MMPRCSTTIQLHVVMIEICFINISSGRSENNEFSPRSWFTRHQHAGLLYGYTSLRHKPRWHCLRIARDALRIIDHVIICTLEKQLLDTGVSLRQRLDDDERPMAFLTQELLLLQEQVNAICMRRRVAQLALITTDRTQQRAGWPPHIGQRCERIRPQLGQMAVERGVFPPNRHRAPSAQACPWRATKKSSTCVLLCAWSSKGILSDEAKKSPLRERAESISLEEVEETGE